MGITVADFVLAALLILAFLYGWRHGTINVVARIGSLILAYQAARFFSSLIASSLVNDAAASAEASHSGWASFLSIFIDTTSAANRLLEIIIFILIFVVVNWAVRKIAYALTDIFGHGLLGKINSALGAIIALLLMMALIIIFVDIILPACAGMGMGNGLYKFLQQSVILLPFMEDLAIWL